MMNDLFQGCYHSTAVGIGIAYLLGTVFDLLGTGCYTASRGVSCNDHTAGSNNLYPCEYQDNEESRM